MLANWLDPEKKQTSHIFMERSSFANWNVAPTEVRLLLFHRNWKIGELFPFLFAFGKDGSQVLEKDKSWLRKLTKGLSSLSRDTFQRDEKVLKIISF